MVRMQNLTLEVLRMYYQTRQAGLNVRSLRKLEDEKNNNYLISQKMLSQGFPAYHPAIIP